MYYLFISEGESRAAVGNGPDSTAQELLCLAPRSANWSQPFQPLMMRRLATNRCNSSSWKSKKSRFLAEYLRAQVSKRLHTMALTDAFKQTLTDTWERAFWYTRAFSPITEAFALRLWLHKYGDHPEQKQHKNSVTL